MKQTARRIISCVIVFVMLFCVMTKCTEVAENKLSYGKTAPFFKYSKDFDVLFFGTSHMKLGVLPLELWNEYGITSYNFGCSSSRIPTTYWLMKNALDYSDPEVVVIDCWGLGHADKTDSSFEFVHEAFDAFPLSKTKICAAFDLIDDPEVQSYEADGTQEKPTVLGLLWDYSVYHNRWNSIGRSDFEPDITNNYGGVLRPLVSKPMKFAYNDGAKFTDYEITGIAYLEKIVSECKEKNIEVLLTYLPYCITSEVDWKEINTVYEIAQKYDLKYINFFEDEIIDYDTDLADYTHLNPSGAWKVTDYIGEFLLSGYGIEDHRSDPHYDHWNLDYDNYDDSKIENIKTAVDLNTYLMLLTDKNFEYSIGAGDTEILNDNVTVNLLRNKGVNIDPVISPDDSGRTVVEVYKADDPYTIIDTAIFARPQNIHIPEEYADRYATRYDEHDGQMSIVYFELYNPDNVLNTVTVAIPQSIGFSENLPNVQGITFQNSLAVRVLR